MMATTQTRRSILRASSGQPILKSAEQRSFSCPRSSFARKPRGTGGLVPVVGQRPAWVLRQSRRARSFLGNIRAIFKLRGQGKCVRSSMDDTLSRQSRDGAGAPIWGYALCSGSRCGGRLSAARACSSYSVQPWRSRLGSSRHSTIQYSLRCAAPYFWVSPAGTDGR